MAHRDRAICLRTADWSETSQVLTFLTREQGVVRAVGKGTKRAKSKSGGAVDLFSEGELVWIEPRGGSLATLTEFHESVTHRGLRDAASRLNAALYLLELTGEMLAEGDPHPRVYDLLHKALARMQHPDAPVQAVVAFFQWRLLRHVGLLGEMRHCVGCGRPLEPAGAGELYFTSHRGGLLCRDCEPASGENTVVIPPPALRCACWQPSTAAPGRPCPTTRPARSTCC